MIGIMGRWASLGVALLLAPAPVPGADLEIADCKAAWGMSPELIRAACPRWTLEPLVEERPETMGLLPSSLGGRARAFELRPLDLVGTLRAAAAAAGKPADEMLATITPELAAALEPKSGDRGRGLPSGAIERGTDRHRLFFVDGRLAEADVQLASLVAHPGDRLDPKWTDPWSPLVAAARDLRRRGLVRFEALGTPAAAIEREVWERAPGATLVVLDRSAGGATPAVTLWERRRSPFAALPRAGAGTALEALALPLAAWLEERELTRVADDLDTELELAFQALAAIAEPGSPSLRVSSVAMSGSGAWSDPADLAGAPDVLLCVVTLDDGAGTATGAFAFDREAPGRGVGVLLELTPGSLGSGLAAAGAPMKPLADLVVDFWVGSDKAGGPRGPGGPLFGAAWRSPDRAQVRWALLRPDVGRTGTVLATGLRPTGSGAKASFLLAAVPDGFDLTLRSERFDPTDRTTYQCLAVRLHGEEVQQLSCDEAQHEALRDGQPPPTTANGLYQGQLGEEPVVGCLVGGELEIYRERDGQTVFLFEDTRAVGRYGEVDPGEPRPEPLGGKRFWVLDLPEGQNGAGPPRLRGVRRGPRALDARFDLRRVEASCAPGFESRRVDRPRQRGEHRVESGVEVAGTLPEFERCSNERSIAFDAVRPRITAAALPKFGRFVQEARRIAAAAPGS